jgi:hypothetical protein
MCGSTSISARVVPNVRRRSDCRWWRWCASIRFNTELTSLPEDYLAEKVKRFADGTKPYEWDDEGGLGVVFDVVWQPLLQILQTSDIYFGSSRMFNFYSAGMSRR